MSNVFNKKNFQLGWKIWQVEVFLTASAVVEMSVKCPVKRTRWPLIGPARQSLVKMSNEQFAECLLILASGMFDHSFYVEMNPDVPRSLAKTIRHYRDHGGIEGRAPSRVFDGARYLALNRDVSDAGINPLAHFVKYGAVEGRLDALRTPQPPLANQRNEACGEASATATGVGQMATLMRSVSIKDSASLAVDISQSTRFAWSRMQERLAETIQELEQAQIALYKRNTDYERTLSANEKMMMELARSSDQHRIAADRACHIEKELADLNTRVEQLSEDLEDANREVVYWRHKSQEQIR